MTSASRPTRRRSLSGHSIESLEWRGLLSNLPTISAAIPAGDSGTAAASIGNSAAAAVSYGQAQPADDTVDSGGDIVGDPSDVQLTTQPADTSVSSLSPTQLVITFSQPGSSFDLGTNDIRLDQVNSDGTTTSMFDPFNWPQELADDDGGNDPTFTQLTIPLPSTLPAGEYQIVLVGGSIISSDISNGRWDPFSDHVISTFTVGDVSSPGGVNTPAPLDPVVVAYSTLQPGTTVQSVIDLGTLDATPVSQPGLLSPLSDSPSVQLYRFTLPAGHHWSLGLSANPQAAAGGLQTTLSLYEIDSNGDLHAVSMGDVGSGVSISPTSPETFVGVDSGTYCLAVSGVYTSPGGGQSTAPFQLGVSATVADQPVSVTGFQLDWANTNDSSPAGLTIEFSGPIALDGFGDAHEATPPLEVVDSQGKVWELFPLGYQDQGNVLTLAFGDPLPSGTYFLKVGSSNGLTDLAGWTPVAGTLPDGVLATWSFEADRTAPPASYLGVVWPGSTEAIRGSSELPDATTSYSHFVAVVPGFYSLQAIAGKGNAEVQIFTEYGEIYLDSQIDLPVKTFQVYLPAGDYTLAWTGQGVIPCKINWTLAVSKIDRESLLNNGVGQWSSLDPGFGSDPGAPTTTSYLTDNGVWQGPIQNSGYSYPTVQTGPVVTPTADVSASTAIVAPIATLNAQELALAPTVFGVAGLPPLFSPNVSAVGPAVSPGATSVAHNSATLPGGIRYRPMKGGLGFGHEESPIVEPEVVATSADSTGGSTAAIAGVIAKDDQVATVEQLSNQADRRALESTEWVTAIGQMVQNWFGSAPAGHAGSPGTESGIRDTASFPATQLVEHRSEGAQKMEGVEDRVENAGFGLPLGVIVATAIAYQSKGPIRRWWKEQRRSLSKPNATRKADGDSSAEPKAGKAGEQDFQVRIIRGPHFMARRVRAEASAHVQGRRESGRHQWK